MRLLDATISPLHRERARSVVEAHLRFDSGGLPSIALVDRLTRWGFPEREAMSVLREMEERGEIQMAGGRWVLAQTDPDAQGAH